MANPFFRFKQFTVFHNQTAMKVTTDACLFGAWCAETMRVGEFEKKNALEIGAGTGLLSLLVAQKNDTIIDTVEIDHSAAEQASENIAASPWKDLIHIHHSDIVHFHSYVQYDCIFSNPPFYENEIESVNDKKNLALHGHGLKLESLFEIISKNLKPNGRFFLLLPYKRIVEIERIIKRQQLTIIRKTLVKQSVHHQPFRLMLMGTNKKEEVNIEENEISIWDEAKQYTPEFTALLKDYYLYL